MICVCGKDGKIGMEDSLLCVIVPCFIRGSVKLSPESALRLCHLESKSHACILLYVCQKLWYACVFVFCVCYVFCKKRDFDYKHIQHACIHTHAHAHMCVYTHACIHMHTYALAHTNMFTHSHVQTLLPHPNPVLLWEQILFPNRRLITNLIKATRDVVSLNTVSVPEPTIWMWIQLGMLLFWQVWVNVKPQCCFNLETTQEKGETPHSACTNYKYSRYVSVHICGIQVVKWAHKMICRFASYAFIHWMKSVLHTVKHMTTR